MNIVDEPLWNENPFVKPNTIIRSLCPLHIRCSSFGLAIFISNDEIAFRESNKIQIFSIAQNKVIHELRHGEEIRDFFLVNLETLISFGYYNIYLWDAKSGRRTCKIKCNERSIPVYGDDENTFILCRHSGIDIIAMETGENANKNNYRVLKTKPFKCSTNKFISIRWATRFADKIVIYKDDGISLIHVSNGTPKFKVVFKHKFLIDERLYYKDITTLNDKYLVHPEGQRIVIRDLRTFRKIRTSMDVAYIPFLDEADGTQFAARLSNISLYRKVILLHFYSADRHDDGIMRCYHAFIISSIETGDILFKYTMFTDRDTTLQKPQIDKRGLILNDGRIVIIDLPQNVFAVAGQESSESQETPLSMKMAYIGCLQDARQSPQIIAEQYITYEKCKVSVEELYCAHRTIMLAIQDERREKKGNKRESVDTFEKVYIAAKELQNGSEEDVKILQNILLEAEDFGLISKGSITLDTVEKLGAVQRKIGKSYQIGKDVITNLWKYQDPTIDIRSSVANPTQKAFQQYKNNQGITELFRLALHFIPFLCGSKRYAIEVGAQLFERWSTKSIRGRIPNEGRGEKSLSIVSLEQDILNFVGTKFKEESIELLGVEQRQRLENIVQKCGTSFTSLMEMLLDGSAYAVREEIVVDPLSNRVGLQDKESISSYGTCPETVNLAACGSSSDLTVRKPNLDCWTMKELSELGISKEEIKEMSTQNCSAILAAYIVRYDDGEKETFDYLQTSLYNALKTYGIDGLVISDRSYFESSKLSKMIVEFINKDKVGIPYDFIMEGKINSFLSHF